MSVVLKILKVHAHATFFFFCKIGALWDHIDWCTGHPPDTFKIRGATAYIVTGHLASGQVCGQKSDVWRTGVSPFDSKIFNICIFDC